MLGICVFAQIEKAQQFVDGGLSHTPIECHINGPITIQPVFKHFVPDCPGVAASLARSDCLRNLKAAVSLHFSWYNFVRIHRTLRVTPAMEAGVTERLWNLEDLLKHELPY